MQNNNERKTRTKYVVYETTVKEIGEFSESCQQEYSETLYEQDIMREDITPEQRFIQNKAPYNTTLRMSIICDTRWLYDIAKKSLYEEISSGVKDGLKEKIKNKLLDSSVRVYLKTHVYNDYIGGSLFVEFGCKDERDIYIEDKNIVGKNIKMIECRNSPHIPGSKNTLIEHVRVDAYVRTWRNIGEKLDAIIQKLFKNEMTYCLKKEKLIVPEEYAKKGEAGIVEWRELKSSKNKNNSMEKRILRGMLRDKKQELLNQMRRLMLRFPDGTDESNWSIPHLCIEGNGNTQYCKRLLTQILKDKTDAEILNISGEDAEKMLKDYWKKVLTKAIEQLEDVEINGDRVC